MSAIVDFYTTALRTYEVQHYNTALTSWEVVVLTEPAANFPYTDTSGLAGDFYRVRDDTDGVGDESPWTPQFIGLSVAPSLCTVSGYLYKADGEPLVDACVQFYVKEDQVIDGKHYSFPDWIETSTNASGYWSQDLVQTITLYAKIPSVHIEEDITVPATSESTLDALL